MILVPLSLKKKKKGSGSNKNINMELEQTFSLIPLNLTGFGSPRNPYTKDEELPPLGYPEELVTNSEEV